MVHIIKADLGGINPFGLHNVDKLGLWVPFMTNGGRWKRKRRRRRRR